MAKLYLGGSSIRASEVTTLTEKIKSPTMSNYLETVFAGLSEGFLVVWHKSTKATRCFHVSKLEDACQYMLSASETDDVYFEICCPDLRPWPDRFH